MRKWVIQDSWTIRKGKQAWIMRHEANSSSCTKIWNSKSSGNIYFDFESKFRALLEVHFRQAIYCFEALEVRNPIL